MKFSYIIVYFVFLSFLLACSSNQKHIEYRDLNKNGKMDPYEDANKLLETRVDDLLKQMTLEEKAGVMFIQGVLINGDGTIEKKEGAEGIAAVLPSAVENIRERKMNHFNLWEVPVARNLAIGINAIQKEAENSRLGIPVTISSDPRHHVSSENISIQSTTYFSQWCETLGFAAIGDEELVREFADIARQEYMAVGIRQALHPQVDLTTEPLWSRINGTFGEDATLTARLAKAYIQGFQGDQLSSNSVACVSKHFPGSGPQKKGYDALFKIQKGHIYPGNNFNYHLTPFESVIEINTASIMTSYGIPTAQTEEDVAAAFNKAVVTGILRERFQYEGVVCTDWGLITDQDMGIAIWPARAWGVEHLSEKERVKKMITAGVDQFGGEHRPELVIALVNEGEISEERINESVRRIVRQKFQLGLFDDPFVDLDEVDEKVGKAEFVAAGFSSQRRAMTLLKNEGNMLPLKGKPKIYVRNVDPSVVEQYGVLVDNPKDADVAILRISTPWYPADSPNPVVQVFHHGDLDFKGEAKEEILQLLKSVPTVVDIYLDRPAVIPEISTQAKALLANYGASDKALLDIIFGKARPEGKLPFELPSSMEAVQEQLTDTPYDSKDPLYPFGFGLSY